MRYLIVSLSCILMASAVKAEECSIVLRVVDSRGKAVPARVAAFRDHAGSEYAERFAGLRAQVPCSIYAYKFLLVRADVDNALTNIVGEAAVTYPENWKTVMINPNLKIFGNLVGIVHRSVPQGYVWRGHVSPAPAPGEHLWVNLRSAVDSRNEESQVEASGDFRFYGGFPEGPYILSLINEDGVLYTVNLSITSFAPTEDLQIDRSSNGRVIVVQ